MRILVVNSGFNALSIGGIRSRLLARGLSERGHVITVLTSTVSSGTSVTEGIDEAYVRAFSFDRFQRVLQSKFSTWKTPGHSMGGNTHTIHHAGKWRNWIHRWCMIPDKMVPWIIPAIREGGRLIKKERYDVIYASTPERSNLVVGAGLARKHRIPLLVEYRDLWTDSPYKHLSLPTKAHQWIHRRIERAVFGQATRITCVSKGIRQSLEPNVFPVHELGIRINYNFFDPACFSDYVPRLRSELFEIVYIGSFYDNRTPYVFFEGLKEFITAQKVSSAEFQFICVGQSYGIGDVTAIVEHYGLTDYVRFIGQVAHEEAIERLYNADAALVVVAPKDSVHIPAKLFEALGAKTPILLVCSPSEAIQILDNCSAGVVCEHQAESVCRGLTQLHSNWKSGETWPFNEQIIEGYTLECAALRFEEVLESTLENG